MEAIVKRCAGLDVHKKTVVVTVLAEREDGLVDEETKEFGTFHKHRKALAEWLLEHQVDLAVMESTGIYWKAIYEILEESGLTVHVVNARHVKQVPGRKTDVLDSHWLASLGRYGLLRPSFIPPEDIRQIRLLTRRRQKISGMIAGEKNRLHKALDDAGIRLGAVVSDIGGVSAGAIIDGLIEGKALSGLMECVHGRMGA